MLVAALRRVGWLRSGPGPWLIVLVGVVYRSCRVTLRSSSPIAALSPPANPISPLVLPPTPTLACNEFAFDTACALKLRRSLSELNIPPNCDSRLLPLFEPEFEFIDANPGPNTELPLKFNASVSLARDPVAVAVDMLPPGVCNPDSGCSRVCSLKGSQRLLQSLSFSFDAPDWSRLFDSGSERSLYSDDEAGRSEITLRFERRVSRRSMLFVGRRLSGRDARVGEVRFREVRPVFGALVVVVVVVVGA